MSFGRDSGRGTVIFRILDRALSRFGPGTRDFLMRTGLTMGSFVVSKGLTTLATILVTRHIGVDSIGRSILIFSWGMFLAAVMGGGLPPTINVYIPKGNSGGKAEWTLGLLGALVLGLLTVLTLGVFQTSGQSYFELSRLELGLAVAVGLGSHAYNLAMGALQGFQLARVRVACEWLMSVATAGVMLLCAYGMGMKELALPIGIAVGAFVGLVPSVAPLARRTSFRVLPPEGLSVMACYAAIAFIGTLASQFSSNIHSVQIKSLLTEGDLGLYAVAGRASTGLAFTLAGAITAILVAKAAARRDKLALTRYILRVWLRLSPAIVAGLIILQVITLLLSRVPLDLWLITTMAVASVLIMVHSTLANVMAGHGLWAALVGLAFSIIHAIITWNLTQWLCPIYGVVGGAVALIGAYAIIIALAVACLPWLYSLPDQGTPDPGRDPSP